MSIQPPSDIILDVARAADPARVKIGASKLQADGAAGDFDDFIASVSRAPAAPVALPQQLGPLGLRMAPIVPREGAASAKDAYRSFEAFLLQSMIGAMLPAKAEQSYGKGTAGSVWKSMMAEHLANGIAKSGGIGIARMLVKAQEGKGEGVSIEAAASTQSQSGPAAGAAQAIPGDV